MPILLSHWVSVSSEIFQELINELKYSEQIKKQHFHLHVMDVHDCISFNRIFIKIYHFKFFPKWIYAKLRGFTNRRLLYDLSLMYVDEKIGDLMNTLEDRHLTDKTAIVISGDHGSSYAESPRNYKHVYFRTYYEDISIPIAAYNCNKNISIVPGKLRDSMSITATLLDFMKILPDKSFLGKGITNSNSNDYVIAESCDSRKPDGLQTNLFFTIIVKKYKIMIVLMENMLHVRHLFDKEIDPKELVDIKSDKDMLPIVEDFMNILFLKRKELLILRKVKRDSWVLE
jgi:arylsulfatase A-like enzyme